MSSLDSVSLVILLGSMLVLAGILSSLIAMRFGAPLLLVFLLVGVLAGENGPGGIKFDDVGVAYTVGAVSLATNWPNPRPASFGYHEVWHTFTLVAGACFAVVVWGLVLGAAPA